jgi:hypothetical protein
MLLPESTLILQNLKVQKKKDQVGSAAFHNHVIIPADFR